MQLTTLLIDLDGVLRLWPRENVSVEYNHNLPAGSIGKTAFEPSLLEQAVTGRISDQEWRREVCRSLACA